MHAAQSADQLLRPRAWLSASATWPAAATGLLAQTHAAAHGYAAICGQLAVQRRVGAGATSQSE